MTQLLASPERSHAEGQAPLVVQLSAAGRILQKERGATAFLRSWLWVYGFVLAAFAADVVLHFEAIPRIIFLSAFALLVVSILGACACIAWIRRKPREHTARVLESRDSSLGSKLINLLQLHGQVEDQRLAPLTRQLAHDAVVAYAEELRAVNLLHLARSGRIRQEASRAAWASVGFLAVLCLGFDITRTEIPRFADPFGDHPPYSFTHLRITNPADDTAQVVYGQNLVIEAKASGHRPGELFLTSFPSGDAAHATTAPMFDRTGGVFAQQIDGIKNDLVILAHTRNRHSVSKQRRVSVILTPKLDHAFVKISPPAYTALPAEEKPLQFKTLKALAGSSVEFRFVSNRPLREGRIEIAKAVDDLQTVAMAPRSENEVSAILIAEASARLRFAVVDRDGHASQETWELPLTVTHDLPPEVQITNPVGDSFVAMDFTVEAVIEATDDYGVKMIRIHQARNGDWSAPKISTYENVTRFAREGLTFNFREMALESGDTFSFFAEAIDIAPDPHIARSKTVTLTVITPEEYNDFLRERTDLADIEAKYADLIGQLQELVEEQKKLGMESDSLRQQLEKAAEERARLALEQNLDQLLAKQNELNAKLNKLADTMGSFIREQPLYDVEAELREILQAKAEQVRESTKDNTSASEKIAERSAPSEGSRKIEAAMFEDFKNASNAQLKKLGAVENQAQQEIIEPLEEMALLHEIIKDLNRFKELYSAQSQLAEHANAYGRSGPLSREDQLALKDLAGLQRQIGQEIEAVEQKLWEDGKAAKEKFPKAGGSAQEIAQRMGDLRLEMLATHATEAMLASRGDAGAQLAGRLRDEMEKLFSECNAQGSGMQTELDQRLSISRGLNARNSFRQMMQSRKFGNGSRAGFGLSSGPAGSGSAGYAVITGADARVLGNETAISRNATLPGEKGRNQAGQNRVRSEVVVEKPDVVEGLNAINRESEAVQGEISIEQYNEIVEKYFKALTK